MSKRMCATGCVVTMFAIAACGVAPEQDEWNAPVGRTESGADSVSESAVNAAPADDPSDPTYVETSVDLDEQGNPVIRQRFVTHSQRVREHERSVQRREARERGIELAETMADHDPLCLGSSTHLFDEPNFDGNSICFKGLFWADLGAFSRVVGPCAMSWWDYSKLLPGCSATISRFNFVRSLKAGDLPGAFTRTSSYSPCDETCATWAIGEEIPDLSAGSCRYLQRGAPPVLCSP